MRALTLTETLVAMTVLILMSALTAVMYSSLTSTATWSANRIEARQGLRATMLRLVPLLSSAYAPPLAGVTDSFVYPAVGAPVAPLNVSFYAPTDLLNAGSTLPTLATSTPHLYHVWLEARLQPDSQAAGGPARTLRNVLLEERQILANGSPGAALGPPRVIGRNLSNLTAQRVTRSGLLLHAEAQNFDRRLQTGTRPVVTTVLETRVYSPVGR